jgi:hypothetical protein
MPSQKNAVHISTRKIWWGGMHIPEFKRHVKTGNSYALCSVYKACPPVRLSVIKVSNFSGFPFKTTKFIQDGRIVGGNETTIENHPHQVEPLNCC